MTPEELEIRRKRLGENARSAILAREQAEDDLILAKFDGQTRGTKALVVMLLQTKRAAELALRNSKISIQTLALQNDLDMIEWE